MSDRGTPITDGATACPFVAFDDDRDTRSTAPDHRHRCYAEPVPAPRAIAHQDAYCLSPAFAVCPTFQDWARREAAAARPSAPAAGPAPRPREEDTSGPVPMAPGDREPRHAPLDPSQPLPPRRPAARDWAAPPPWLSESDEDEATGSGSAPQAPGAIPGWGGSAAAGAAGAAGAAAAGRAWADGRPGEGRGLAESAAARLAGPDPDLPPPARPTPSWAVDPEPDDDADADADSYDTPAPVVAPRQPAASPRAGRPASPPVSAPLRDGARPVPRDAQELFGPAWERPRRYEAYPSLKTRVGLPSLGGIPRLGIAAIALVIAAVFLFFVSPMLLGLGKHTTPQGSVAPSGAASAGPSATPLPTITASPRPTIYTVVAGDTMSGIAQKFGVSLAALRAANPSIKNLNSIKIGDQINIPPAAGSSGGAVSGASASPVTGASAGP